VPTISHAQRCSVAQVIRLTKVYPAYDEYKPVNTKVPKAKVYPREIIQAFKELEAIQPPPGFAEYQQRVKRADKKLEDACKKHGIDSWRVIIDFRSS
jgi:Ni,Fe-hydrogenase III small subunit